MWRSGRAWSTRSCSTVAGPHRRWCAACPCTPHPTSPRTVASPSWAGSTSRSATLDSRTCSHSSPADPRRNLLAPGTTARGFFYARKGLINMAFQSRGAWTSRPNRAVKTRFKQKHLTWHYPGFGTDSVKTANWSHDRCLSQIDTWEKQHQARGSKNIEYNYFACAHGYLIEGRGNRQNGSNGTSASNRRGQSVQVLVGDNEPLTPGHRAA